MGLALLLKVVNIYMCFRLLGFARTSQMCLHIIHSYTSHLLPTHSSSISMVFPTSSKHALNLLFLLDLWVTKPLCNLDDVISAPLTPTLKIIPLFFEILISYVCRTQTMCSHGQVLLGEAHMWWEGLLPHEHHVIKCVLSILCQNF